MSYTISIYKRNALSYLGQSLGLGVIVSIVCIFYILFNPRAGYDITLQVYAMIPVFTMISIGYLFIRAKEIAFGIFFLTLYQTWNMFLSPYLGAEEYTSIYRTINRNYLGDMAFFSMLSVITLYIGFIWGYSRFKTNPFWDDIQLPLSRLRILVIVTFLFGLLFTTIFTFLDFIGVRVSFLGSISSMMPTVVLSLYTMLWLRGDRNPVFAVFVLLYGAYNFIVATGGTLFIKTIILFLGPVITYIVVKRKIPYKALAIIVILLLPSFLTRHQYRSKGLYMSSGEAFYWGLSILEEQYSNISIDYYEKLLEKNETDQYEDNRFEGVTYLGQIVYCHKDRDYPFLLGKTFIWLPTMMFPRALIPFRPGQNMGDEWAIYYGTKDRSWKASINFPMLVEFYCNFGYIGMVLLSLLNGMAIAWVMGKLNFGHGDLNMLLLLFISLQLIVVEANVTLNYGMIVQVIFLCWIIKKIKYSVG